jgi:hypothetical protein
MIRECKLKNLQMPRWHISFGTHVLLAGRKLRYMPTCDIEPNKNGSHRNKIQVTKTSHQRKGENSAQKVKSDKTLNQNQNFCEIHGKYNHSSSQCDVIQKQLEETSLHQTIKRKRKILTVPSIIPDHIHAKSRNRIFP